MLISRARTWFATCTVLAVLLAAIVPFSVAKGAGEVVGLTLTPPSYELTANPGEKLEQSIRLRNQSSDTVTYVPVVERFTVVGSEGVTQLQGTSDEDPTNISPWFSFQDQSLTLKPQEVLTTNFSIQVPKAAAPGSYFASVIYQAKSVQGAQSTGAQVVQRVGSLLILTVRGLVREEAAVTRSAVRQYTGQYEEQKASDGKSVVYTTRDDVYKEADIRSYLSYGPVALDFFVKNSGNVNIRPVGTVSITNMFGKKVVELILDGKNVFPGAERRITALWPEKSLWGGRYKANLVAIYGSNNQLITSEVIFWAFPWLPVTISLLIFILIFLARNRLIRAFSVLVKGR